MKTAYLTLALLPFVSLTAAHAEKVNVKEWSGHCRITSNEEATFGKQLAYSVLKIKKGEKRELYREGDYAFNLSLENFNGTNSLEIQMLNTRSNRQSIASTGFDRDPPRSLTLIGGEYAPTVMCFNPNR